MTTPTHIAKPQWARAMVLVGACVAVIGAAASLLLGLMRGALVPADYAGSTWREIAWDQLGLMVRMGTLLVTLVGVGLIIAGRRKAQKQGRP